MIHLFSWLAAIQASYRKCPHCGHIQHFKGKKKGDTVSCKKCGNKFVLR